MGPTADKLAREERRTIAYSAAAIYLGAVAIAGLETALPGGPQNSIGPGLVAVLMAVIAVAVGPRLPRSWLAVFAPIGVAVIAYALATTRGGPTDGAVLYMWPVLWMSYFYGRAGAAFIVAVVALAHGLALSTMPDEIVSMDRWIDVVASVTVVAAVVRYLAARNARLVKDLQEQARVDPLTGLLNRRGLEERTEIELRRTLRYAAPMAVAIVDIDHFKTVNDEHGHEVGDRVLAWVGDVLARESRGVDVAARTGGDEFAVLMPEGDAAGGQRFADRVRRAIADSEAANRGRFGLPPSLALTVSMGVASASARDAEPLMKAADEALYVAKGEGGDRVVAADYDALRATPAQPA